MSSLYFNIAIEGTIGVGKTSMAKILSKRLDGRLLLEEFEANPFLAEFYNNPERFAFQTQLFFLLSRYRQQQEIHQTDLFTKTLITDYMFMKDRLFAALNLNDKEMSLYNSISRILEKNIAEPDMVIFLQADTDHLMNNINKRGREYERTMEWKYIAALNQVYNEYFFRYDKSRLLIINTNEIDFVNDQNDLEEIIQFIRTPGEGTRYFNPMKNI